MSTYYGIRNRDWPDGWAHEIRRGYMRGLFSTTDLNEAYAYRDYLVPDWRSKPEAYSVEELHMEARGMCCATDTRWRTRFLCFWNRGYVCTLLEGHRGDHIAEGDPTPIIHQWPQDNS